VGVRAPARVVRVVRVVRVARAHARVMWALLSRIVRARVLLRRRRRCQPAGLPLRFDLPRNLPRRCVSS